MDWTTLLDYDTDERLGTTPPHVLFLLLFPWWLPLGETLLRNPYHDGPPAFCNVPAHNRLWATEPASLPLTELNGMGHGLTRTLTFLGGSELLPYRT